MFGKKKKGLPVNEINLSGKEKKKTHGKALCDGGAKGIREMSTKKSRVTLRSLSVRMQVSDSAHAASTNIKGP